MSSESSCRRNGLAINGEMDNGLPVWPEVKITFNPGRS